ncbi:MAG TPA: threonine synthase, partial [Atribacterota bacterium]|nr:threonine synthase [Atribacterota bacterium]
FKFNRSVLAALSGKEYIQNIDELYLLEELSRQTGLSLPEMLQDLGNKKIRHHLVYDKEDAQKSLQDILKIQ